VAAAGEALEASMCFILLFRGFMPLVNWTEEDTPGTTLG
jgi:hypothetical protein